MEEQKVKEVKMSTRDARARIHAERLRSEQEKHEEELASAERKWKFRYENQDKRIKELEATIRRQRTKIRELKAE